MESPIFLQGLAVRFFRGIGPDSQKLGPFKTFNFFVGPNNAGKSTILDLIERRIDSSKDKGDLRIADRYNGKQTGEFYFAIGVTAATFADTAMKTLSGDRFRDVERPIRSIAEKLAEDDGLIWIKPPARGESIKLDPALLEATASVLDRDAWYRLWHLLTNQRNGDLRQHWIPDTVQALYGRQSIAMPKVRFIPTHRQIGPTSEEFNDFSGRGLIDRLAELQSPDHDKRAEILLFTKINSFLQAVTSRTDARIEVPHNRQHVLVHMDDKVLPLSSLGTGIHEVVMIAAFCTISEHQIVCIEEPESHLHPLLQRKLIAYLKAETSNQYFIATHSPSFIDTPDAAIFHVTNDGSQTRIKESILRSQRFAICSDLGIRASDIVQSNFVIWVEGPSDRLYVRRWIQSMDDGLVEGIHYSIMFYGGRLLSHLTATDDEVTEFIKLRSLNQHLCVIMDSDKGGSHTKLNETKKRILAEFDRGQSKAWVTKGREIENYLPQDRLRETLQAIYPRKFHSIAGTGQYDHALHFWPTTADGKRGKKVETSVDKVSVAKHLTESELDLNVLDLKRNVTDLVFRIRSANV